MMFTLNEFYSLFNSMLDSSILQKIVSEQLLKYSSQSYETDFDKFISNGINTFIKNNSDIKEQLLKFINSNMIHINATDILTKIIMNKNLHNSQTQDFIKAYSYFARKTLVSMLFDSPYYLKHIRNLPYLQNSKSLSSFQGMLMTNSYFELPKDMVVKSIQDMLKYVRNQIDSLRISRFHTYVVGHFIESILTETKYYSACDSLRRCMCVDKENKKWLYTEADFETYSKRIESLISKISWGNFKGNCYLYSTFPYVYVDYVVKSNHTEDELINHFNQLVKLISTKISNFKLFRNSLKGYISSVLLLSSETTENEIKFKELSKFKKIRFKGSVITNTPLMFENDMITAKDIIEIKTGITEIKKNMCKLMLENLMLSFNNIDIKNLIIFNPRSTVVSFISANKFASLLSK